MRPIIASTAFAGPGLDSIKFACINGRYLRNSARAVSQSLASAALVRRDISAGISFDTTDTIPTPPGAPENVYVLPCADILTDSIRRIFTDDSVSEVFDGENQLF